MGKVRSWICAALVPGAYGSTSEHSVTICNLKSLLVGLNCQVCVQKILPTKKPKTGQNITKFFDSSKDGVHKPQVGINRLAR